MTVAFAIAAHPDDIEFCMAGTMVLLGRRGCQLHYMNVATGSCGSTSMDAAETAAVRLEEARKAAVRLGATFHEPLAADLEIMYEIGLLRKLAAVIREVAPDILLIPSPQDYMEDHTNVARLAVTAAFSRGMPNFPTDPARAPVANQVTLYHAQPYGNRDGMNQVIRPDLFVDISSSIDVKAAMLADHRSQKKFLDETQGFDAYIDKMREDSRQIGAMAGGFVYAEGWRRHNPTGFCAPDADPLRELLAEYAM